MTGSRCARAAAISSILITVQTTSGCTPKTQEGVDVQRIGPVREIVYTDPVPPVTDPYSIVEGTVFGADQGRDTYFLTRASPQGLDTAGNLYIIDVRRTQVHWYDPDGRHLGMFGKRGQGPGEFQVLQDCIVDGDRLYVNDPFNGRMTIFNLQGKMLKLITYPQETVISPYLTLFGPKDNRRYFVFDVQSQREAGREGFRIARLDERMGIVDAPIDSIRSIDVVWIGIDDVVVPYFGYGIPQAALAPDFPIAWSYGEEFRIEFLDPVELSRWAVTIPHEAIPVSRAMKEDAYKRFERSNQVEEARRKLIFASHLPHLFLPSYSWDTTGRLWVQEMWDHTASDITHRFYVFSKSGEWLFRQDLPERPRLITGKGFYCTAEDEEGNPVIQFYRFVER